MPVQAIDVRRHRQKIASALEEELVLDDGSAYSTAVVYLSGDRHHERHGTDVELPFRQESNFYYATGVEMEAGYALLYHPASGYAALIVPFVSLEDAVWIGAAPPRDIVRTRYDVDGVFFDDEEGSRAVVACLKAAMYREKIYAVHTMAGATIPETLSKALNSAHTETKHLAAALTAARLHKEPAELACMRIANRASSDAHAALMRAVSKLSAKGTAWNEQQATAVWYSEVISRGCMLQAYQPIVAYGPNAATLHYNRNDADVPAGGDSFLLVDAGGEYRCYAADITRTYPVGGKFSADQRALYEVVLRAQMTVLGAVRAGVEWEALHRRAVEVVGQGLVDMGVLKLNGATVQDLCWKLFVVQRFFPHGRARTSCIFCCVTRLLTIPSTQRTWSLDRSGRARCRRLPAWRRAHSRARYPLPPSSPHT